jgi:trigger factor
MEVTLNKVEDHMAHLTIKIETVDMEEHVEKVYQRLIKNMEIPIFERGTDPIAVLEKNIGRDNFIEYVVKEMSPVVCSNVIKEQKIVTNMQPLIKILEKDPLILEMIVPLKPAVELCDYHNLKIERESLEVTEEEVSFVLEGLRKQFADYKAIDRPVEEGDMVTADIIGFAVASTFINKKGIKFQVTTDFWNDIPGFYTNLIGMNKGEEKEFTFKLPVNYGIDTIAGKDAKFKVKIIDVMATVLPDLNDTFANKVAPGVKTLDNLKDRIRKNIIKDREENSETRFEYAIMDAIIKKSNLKYPHILIDIETEALVNQYKQELQYMSPNTSEYENKSKEISDDEIKERVKPIAEKRVLWSIIIDALADKEKIEIKDNEVDEEIENILNNSDDKESQNEYFNDDTNRQNVYSLLKARKTIKRISDIIRNN